MTSKVKEYPKEMLLDMYKMMLSIRAFESKAAECFTKGMLAGNIHLCIGQEAVPTGACFALEPEDYMTSTHRGHGHCIAKGAALDKMLAVSRYMREHFSLKLRLNTNGLSDLIHKRPTAEEICSAVDAVSISLNMPDAKSYCETVRPAYGEAAFDAMLKFASDCKAYTDQVRFSVVDIIGEENVRKCQELSDSLGIVLRVRQYEG